MRIAVALLSASLLLAPSVASAQAKTQSPAAASWVGKHVLLAKVGSSTKAPACPERRQIDHYVREKLLKWDNASMGCRFMLSGNFKEAKVLEEDGAYLRVNFALVSHPVDAILWVPKKNFRTK